MSDRRSKALAITLAGLNLLLLLAAVVLNYLSRSEIQITEQNGWWLASLIQIAPPAAFIIVGGIVSARRPRNAYGWVMIAHGAGNAVQVFWASYGMYSFQVAEQPLPLAHLSFFLTGVGWMLWATTFPLLLLLYPTGKLPSPRWRVVLWLLAIAFVVGSVASAFTNATVGWFDTSNPFALEESALVMADAILQTAVLLTFALLPICGLGLLLRALKSTGVERLQYTWFAYAAFILVAVFILDFYWEPPEPWESLKEALPEVLMAIAVGMAIMRYRLFDIDVIVRRTTTYAILSGTLALIYLITIVLLQSVLSPVTGNSYLAIVLSTLLIAALFLPLRRRVQASIDMRFFRRKYDAEQVLEKFAATVRDETDLDALTAELVRVIDETMQPEFVSIWLRPSQEIVTVGDGTQD